MNESIVAGETEGAGLLSRQTVSVDFKKTIYKFFSLKLL